MMQIFPHKLHVERKEAVTRNQRMGDKYLFENVLRTGISII